MILRCKKCRTTYHLDQKLLEPDGAKVRCTRCGFVFWVDAPPAEVETHPYPKGSSTALLRENEGEEDVQVVGIPPSRKFLWLISATLAAFLVLFSVRFLYVRYRHPSWSMSETWSEIFFLSSDAEGRREIRLTSHSRYFVENEKIGRIFVISGTVTNGYPTARREIRIRGSLKTADQKVADSREVLAGWRLSREEVEALSPEDLQRLQEEGAAYPVKDLSLPPGQSLPFMILFPRPPQGATHVSIEVVGSRAVPASSPLSPGS